MSGLRLPGLEIDMLISRRKEVSVNTTISMIRNPHQPHSSSRRNCYQQRSQAMKTPIKNMLLLPALVAGLGLILAGQATAQTFTSLYTFTNGSDGANPWAGLVLSGNTLYGLAYGGGASGNGTVFAVKTDGTGFTNLHSFTALSRSRPYTNSDGASPFDGLVLSGNTLFGTASDGGLAGDGTVFALNTNGTAFATLYSFTNAPDGFNPWAGLILSSNTLYGTTSGGGSLGDGTVFAVETNGAGYMTLHMFANSDGELPLAGLVLSGNTLYGTADAGGSSRNGTVFAVNTNGTGFTNLHNFTADPGPLYTNSDGAEPYAGLILSGNTLYGTTDWGGSLGDGTVFAVNTNGTGFTNLYYFTATSGSNSTNSDGAEPHELILSANTLYGTAVGGGSSGNGTVFAVQANGTDFAVLHSFTGNDGATPQGRLVLSSNTLYGTTTWGGSSGNGTVFSLTLPGPQLTIYLSGENVVLTWPTNAIEFTLQSTASLLSPAVWIADSPAPVVVNGQNVVTNFISGTEQFYRLSQ
jgi:uncharacterized repeat protein (TIGR03803 family)